MALGTDKLPRLFVASLFLTFLTTPLASAFLNRSPARERGLQLLFRALSLSVLGECFFGWLVERPCAPLVLPEWQR